MQVVQYQLVWSARFESGLSSADWTDRGLSGSRRAGWGCWICRHRRHLCRTSHDSSGNLVCDVMLLIQLGRLVRQRIHPSLGFVEEVVPVWSRVQYGVSGGGRTCGVSIVARRKETPIPCVHFLGFGDARLASINRCPPSCLCKIFSVLVPNQPRGCRLQTAPHTTPPTVYV
jgi:hypothetical protein